MKHSAQTSIQISVAKQRLTLKRGRATQCTYPVSTSKYGLGSEEGSFKTPLGRFRIAKMIGNDNPMDTAYKGRQRIKTSAKGLDSDDLVMSRILWLDGMEPGNANTFARYIYIHGTNHEELIGQPASHGCIRMRNADVAELFELVGVDTPVRIIAPRSRESKAKRGEKSIAQRKRAA